MMKNRERYARQIMLDEIGEQGQQKLSSAKVLVIGAGGLGSPLIAYLAGAGVGKIGIADDDTVGMSNLQRQVLYSEAEIGKPKAEIAAEKAMALNSSIKAVPYCTRIDESNAVKIISGYDIIADGTDNFKTRYIISDICRNLGKTYVYAAIGEFTGQISVLCGKGCRKTYRDIYPEETEMVSMPQTPKAVIGTTPAVAGSLAANEIIKIICGYGEILYDKMLAFDLKSCTFQSISL